MAENQEKVMVYIDNSNIFLEAQKISAKFKDFNTNIKDVNCRIDVGKLVKEVVGYRQLIHGKLYGSKPPYIDTVWNAFRKDQIKVRKHDEY